MRRSQRPGCKPRARIRPGCRRLSSSDSIETAPVKRTRLNPASPAGAVPIGCWCPSASSQDTMQFCKVTRVFSPFLLPYAIASRACIGWVSYTVQRLFAERKSRESCKCVGGTHVRTQPPRPSYLGARTTRRLIRSPSWPSAKGKNYPNKRPATSRYERIGPQADFGGHETAMGKMERKVSSQEGQEPSCNECRRQEAVVYVDEGTLGREAQGESITESLDSRRPAIGLLSALLP